MFRYRLWIKLHCFVFFQVAKLLNADRSRAIGIKMSSLNCQLEDIRNAVYNMDTSVVDMER